jgi:50S ribosomal protein L16 3-hydroxylase
MAGEAVDGGFQLPEPFWQEFIADYWGRKPGVFKRPSPVPFATPQDFYEVLVAAGGQLGGGAGLPGPRFYLDGQRGERAVADPLPLESDGSLDGYAARIQARFPGREFGIIVNSVHRLSERVWWRSLDVAQGLCRHVGQPAGGTDLVLFFNHCQRSAFGVHKDSLENITFVVQGRKRFLMWPFEVLQEAAGAPDNGRWSNLKAEGLDPERFREQATVLEGEPGDVIYFPTAYWHVAEWAPGSVPTATISFATSLHAFSANSPAQQVGEVLKEIEEAGRVYEAPALFPSPLAAPGPEGLDRTLASVGAHLERLLADARFKREAEERTLAWLTAFGYRNPPAERTAPPLAEHDVLQGDRRYPVLWREYGTGDIVCAIHGHLLHCPPRLLPLVQALNGGAARSVESLLAQFGEEEGAPDGGGRLKRDEVLAALQLLYSVRALHLVPAAQSAG